MIFNSPNHLCDEADCTYDPCRWLRERIAEERERCAEIAESICQHRKGPGVTCEFGEAPAIIAKNIRDDSFPNDESRQSR